jgi:hypothetical protein
MPEGTIIRDEAAALVSAERTRIRSGAVGLNGEAWDLRSAPSAARPE